MSDAPNFRPPLTGAALNRRQMMVGTLAAAASAVAIARQPELAYRPVKEAELDRMIPRTIGPWQYATASGLVLPPQDALADRLYDNLLTRTYLTADGAVAMLLIAYNNSQDGVVQLHRPEVCYPFGGFKLTETVKSDLPVGRGSLPVREFTATSAQRSEHVLYWTRIGDEFPQDWLTQRLAVVRSNLQKKLPDGLLVRVSTIGEDVATGNRMLASFVTQMLGQMTGPGRKLLLGNNL